MGIQFTDSGILFTPSGIAFDPACCCNPGCFCNISLDCPTGWASSYHLTHSGITPLAGCQTFASGGGTYDLVYVDPTLPSGFCCIAPSGGILVGSGGPTNSGGLPVLPYLSNDCVNPANPFGISIGNIAKVGRVGGNIVVEIVGGYGGALFHPIFFQGQVAAGCKQQTVTVANALVAGSVVAPLLPQANSHYGAMASGGTVTLEACCADPNPCDPPPEEEI